MIKFERENDGNLFEATLRFAEKQVRRLIETHPDFYPMYTKDGLWKHDMPAWTHWCDGFLPGMMWIFHSRQEAVSDEARWWYEQAIRYTKPLEPRKLESKKPYTQMTEVALVKCTPVRVKRLTETFYAEGGAVVREGTMPSPGEVQYMTWDRPKVRSDGAKAFSNICATLTKKAKAKR